VSSQIIEDDYESGEQNFKSIFSYTIILLVFRKKKMKRTKLDDRQDPAVHMDKPIPQSALSTRKSQTMLKKSTAPSQIIPCDSVDKAFIIFRLILQ